MGTRSASLEQGDEKGKWGATLRLDRVLRSWTGTSGMGRGTQREGWLRPGRHLIQANALTLPNNSCWACGGPISLPVC